MKISLTLPSIHPAALARTISNIRATATMHEIEMVVCSPFPMAGDGIVWIEDQICRGNCPAHQWAFEKATGDLVAAFVDDRLFRRDWDFLLVKDFLARESNGARPFCLGIRQNEIVGTVFGKPYAYFPMMRRTEVAPIGGFFDSAYHNNWGDCDLGMRVAQAGGRVEFSTEVVMDVHPDDWTRGRAGPMDAADAALFVQRWGPIYGAGYDLGHTGNYNKDINLKEIGYAA